MVAASCINSLNPKIAKIALPRFSVPVSPILGLHGRVFGVPEKFGAPSPVTFRFIQDPFTAFSTSWSVGCSRHSLSPGFRAPHRQAVVLVSCPPTSPVSLRNSFGRWATGLPWRLTKWKILFNPCLVCPIQDRSFSEKTFPLAALRGEQMPPARLAAQDFPGASHFKTLGYRLFRLTSSDRFWHKERVKYALPRDSQGQKWPPSLRLGRQ
jgi:hypothetical protein